MPAKTPPLAASTLQRLAQLGEQLRTVRKQQGVTAAAAAEAAGMSRVTLHRIEKGEGSVTMGAWQSAAAALGLQLSLADPRAPAGPPLPPDIRLADFPQLQQLAWQLPGVVTLAPREALSLYERNWRHVDTSALIPAESALIEALVTAFRGGRPIV